MIAALPKIEDIAHQLLTKVTAKATMIALSRLETIYLEVRQIVYVSFNVITKSQCHATAKVTVQAVFKVKAQAANHTVPEKSQVEVTLLFEQEPNCLACLQAGTD